MAKRELSSTLKNLKFMQRASLKETKPKEQEEDEDEEKPKPHGIFGASPVPARRCIVIMEGNPHPGALKGRMSFQSFNPSIEKINEEAANAQAYPSSIHHQNSRFSDRASDSNVAKLDDGPEIDHKRKHLEMGVEPPSPPTLQKSGGGDHDGQSSSQSNRKGSYKQQKREKLDWNILRPPKAESKRA